MSPLVGCQIRCAVTASPAQIGLRQAVLREAGYLLDKDIDDRSTRLAHSDCLYIPTQLGLCHVSTVVPEAKPVSGARRLQAAGDLSASPVDLEQYAEDESTDVRAAVARNPNTPAAVLERLAQDRDRGIRTAVAGNSQTPPETLRRLAEWAPWSVASNPATPSDLLAQLATRVSQSEYTLGQILAHPNVPVSVLEDCSLDPRWRVRLAVAQSRRVTGELLRQLAGDSATSVRRAVAQHPNLPASVREQLVHDRDDLVRTAARRGVTNEPRTLDQR